MILEVITFIFKIISTHFHFFSPFGENVWNFKSLRFDLGENFNDLRKKSHRREERSLILSEKWKISVPFQINRGIYLSALSSNGNFNYLQIAAINGKSISNEQTRKFHLKSQNSSRWQEDFPHPATKLSSRSTKRGKSRRNYFRKFHKSGVGSSTETSK